MNQQKGPRTNSPVQHHKVKCVATAVQDKGVCVAAAVQHTYCLLTCPVELHLHAPAYVHPAPGDGQLF